MILLDATTRKLQIVLAGAKTSNDSPWVASYVDISQSTFGMTGASSATGASNGVTAVDVVAAPAATTTRQLKYFSLLNADTVAITATVRYNDNATIRNMVTFIIPVGASLVYNAESGWVVQSYARGQSLGTGTNDSAAAGNVGEIVTASIAVGSAVALTTITETSLMSVSLSPGDWDVSGTAWLNGGATTVLREYIGGINTSAALPARADVNNPRVTNVCPSAYTPFATDAISVAFATGRVSLAAAGTAYLVVYADFTTSTCTGFGALRARRAR